MKLETGTGLFVTLPKGTSSEFLGACKKEGATGVRIHSAKMSTAEAAQLTKNAHDNGFLISYDTSGLKPRVIQSPGMIENEYISIGEGSRIVFVDNSIHQINANDNVCVLSILPQGFVGDRDRYKNEEHLNLVDGKIKTKITHIDRDPDGRITAIHAEVMESTEMNKISINMGANSDTTDIYSGTEPVLTHTDIERLVEFKNLLRSGEKIDQIALSFVSVPEQITQAKNTLASIGLEDVPILVKIETFDGVKNIYQIAKVLSEDDEIEVARGDLGDAYQKKEPGSLLKAVLRIVDAAKSSNRRVITGTHVADSIWNQIEKNGPIANRLSYEERINILYLLRDSAGFMLAGETMRTREKALQVIQRTKRAIEVAHRYWRLEGFKKVDPQSN